VIYLSPGDYHRYHSPAKFVGNYRRHIIGYLEPVKPSYVQKHKNVLKDNERVTVLGDWSYGFFAMSFVGALNVGSIVLNWDEELNTNQKKPQMPFYLDKNYATLQEDTLKKVPEAINHVKVQSKKSYSMAEHLGEFDIKDIHEGNGKDFSYDASQENKLAFNANNNFN
jgi:phosphatidylserine decarboxylase